MDKNILNMYLSIICIKQHLSNIWSSTHQKIKQHQGKNARLIKKSMYLIFFSCFSLSVIYTMSKLWRKVCVNQQVFNPGSRYIFTKKIWAFYEGFLHDTKWVRHLMCAKFFSKSHVTSCTTSMTFPLRNNL